MKPKHTLRWATDKNARRIEPLPSVKEEGFSENNHLSQETLNWWMYHAHKWNRFFLRTLTHVAKVTFQNNHRVFNNSMKIHEIYKKLNMKYEYKAPKYDDFDLDSTERKVPSCCDKKED